MDTLKFVLNTQRQDGSWAIVPASQNQSDSSIYATGWAVLALHEHLRNHRVPAEQQNAVDHAVGAGVQYLISERLPGKARWRDYPHAEDAVESISDSGLALHILHRVRGDNIDPMVDRLWLENLPDGPIGAMESEKSGHRIEVEGVFSR